MTTERVTVDELRDLASRHGAQPHVDTQRREAFVRIAQTRYVAELEPVS